MRGRAAESDPARLDSAQSLDEAKMPHDDSEETVEVVISATQKVRYAQYATMRRSVFEKYQEMCERRARDDEFDKEFGHYIRYDDVLDADELEDLTIELDSDHGTAER